MCQHKTSVLLYSRILWARAQAEGVDSAPPGGSGSQWEDWSDWDPTELSFRQCRWGLSLWPAAPSFQKREHVRRPSIPEKQEETAGPFPSSLRSHAAALPSYSSGRGSHEQAQL